MHIHILIYIYAKQKTLNLEATMILWEKNITESIYVCKYHSSLLLLRHLDLRSSAQSVEVRTFTHHTNSFLTSAVSSPRRFRPVGGAETLSGVIWTVAVNGPIDPGAGALGVLPQRERERICMRQNILLDIVTTNLAL